MYDGEFLFDSVALWVLAEDLLQLRVGLVERVELLDEVGLDDFFDFFEVVVLHFHELVVEVHLRLVVLRLVVVVVVDLDF